MAAQPADDVPEVVTLMAAGVDVTTRLWPQVAGVVRLDSTAGPVRGRGVRRCAELR